jgi:hypothetical protein
MHKVFEIYIKSTTERLRPMSSTPSCGPSIPSASPCTVPTGRHARAYQGSPTHAARARGPGIWILHVPRDGAESSRALWGSGLEAENLGAMV